MTSNYKNDSRQLDLVDWLAGRARKSDPSTSRKAASRVNVKRLNVMVLNALKACGPMTTEEISMVIRRNLQSVTPRMAPLVERGLIRNSGRTRRGSSNRERILWELVDADQEEQKPAAPVLGEDARLSDL